LTLGSNVSAVLVDSMSSTQPFMKPSAVNQQVPWLSDETILWAIILGSFAVGGIIALTVLLRHFNDPEPAEIRVVLRQSKHSSKQCAKRKHKRTLTRIRNQLEHESSTASTYSPEEPSSLEKIVHRPGISRHTMRKNLPGEHSQHAMEYTRSVLLKNQSPNFSRLAVIDDCPVSCEHYSMSVSSLSRGPSLQSDISFRTDVSARIQGDRLSKHCIELGEARNLCMSKDGQQNFGQVLEKQASKEQVSATPPTPRRRTIQ